MSDRIAGFRRPYAGLVTTVASSGLRREAGVAKETRRPLARYRAKTRTKKGGETARVYLSETNDASAARATMRDRLRDALAKEQFELHYQPKIDVRTNKVAGCVLRWQHPQRCVQSRATFVPVAEETGLISIGEWVIREACRQYAAWRSESVALERVRFHPSDIARIRHTAPSARNRITEGMLLICSRTTRFRERMRLR